MFPAEEKMLTADALTSSPLGAHLVFSSSKTLVYAVLALPPTAHSADKSIPGEENSAFDGLPESCFPANV
jgi:hypothetical protein